MISTIHSNRIKEYLTGKIIDLRKYNYIQYKIYNYNEEGNLELNIKPLIELVQILKQLHYLWGNGLGLHINNFSDLTEQGKINRELLKTHSYIVFEDEFHINMMYNYRGNVDLEESEVVSIEDILDYYWKYKTEKIGVSIIPDFREIMIGDFINLYPNKEYTDRTLEITGVIYERQNSYCPSRFHIKRTRKYRNIRGHELIDEYTINYLELKEILHSDDLEGITRVFQGKPIIKYRRS